MATSYQLLIDECKKHYNNGDLKNAWLYWCDINDLFFEKLNEYDKHDEKNRQKEYHIYHKYMEQFTDNEVFKITDYGKEQYYIKNGYIKL